MKKLLTHWTIAFVTLFILTFIGFKDPQVKEILRLKGFDLLLQSEERQVSKDIGIITIDEKAIEEKIKKLSNLRSERGDVSKYIEKIEPEKYVKGKFFLKNPEKFRKHKN